MENKVDIYDDVIIDSIVTPLQIISKKKASGCIKISVYSWDGSISLDRKICVELEDIEKFLTQNVQDA